jgi:hypothetical protein
MDRLIVKNTAKVALSVPPHKELKFNSKVFIELISKEEDYFIVHPPQKVVFMGLDSSKNWLFVNSIGTNMSLKSNEFHFISIDECYRENSLYYQLMKNYEKVF